MSRPSQAEIDAASIAQLIATCDRLAAERDSLRGVVQAVEAAIKNIGLRVQCRCGHDRGDHRRAEPHACTESADRVGWYCPCKAFEPTGAAAILIRDLHAALAAAVPSQPAEPPTCEHGEPGPHTYCPHNNRAGTCRQWSTCLGPSQPADQPAKEQPAWHCKRCGSDRWVAASLTGGVTVIKQCVPCGRYSGDRVLSPAVLPQMEDQR